MSLERVASQAAVVILLSLAMSVDADDCACVCCSFYLCDPTVVGHASTKEQCVDHYSACAGPASGGPGISNIRCSAPPPPTGVNLPNIDISYAATVPLGLIFLPIGLLTALLGYRLWKYVVFVIGFLFVGGTAAAIALGSAVANGDAHPEASVLLAFLIGGVCGGFCFIAMYFIVIFCAGCGCGTTVVYVLALAVWSIDPSSLTTTGFEAVSVVAVIGGIAMGFVFLKFHKVCIILVTAQLGSSLTWYSIFYGFFHVGFSKETIIELLILASTAIAFYIQWNYTAKGVDVDPNTGQVTIVVVPGQPAFLGRIDQFTRVAPAGQPPQAATGLQWHEQQVVAPPIHGHPVWTQPNLVQPLAQHQYQHQQLQQQQGLQAPLIQNVEPGSASLIIQNTSPPAVAKAGPVTLTEFCAQNMFGAFEVALAQLGVAEPSELEDVTDEQLQAIGFNAIQLKRLRRQIPAASSAGPTAPTTQISMPQAVAAVDQSVDVSAPPTGSIGGAE